MVVLVVGPSSCRALIPNRLKSICLGYANSAQCLKNTEQGPPSTLNISSKDIDQYAEIHRHSWDLDYEQLTKGRFFAFKEVRQTDEGLIYRETHNQRMRAVGGIRTGTICIAVVNEAAKSGRFWGKAHPPHGVIFVTDRRGPDLILEKDYEGIIAAVPEDIFREGLGILTGSAPAFLDEGSSIVELTPSRAARLKNQMQTLVEQGPEAFGSGSLTDQLIDGVARALPKPQPVVVRTTAQRGLVRRFIEEAEANSYRLSIAELCLKLRASQRAVHYAFTSQVGESAKAYLMHRQLNLARRRLKIANPNLQTVTNIAIACGITELGRFSVRYRELFGESPSETLNQPSRD